MFAIALVLSLCVVAVANAQLLPTVTPRPATDKPAKTRFDSRETPLFEAGQIADRPTADLRPRFHWGLYGSVIPHWSIPGSMGKLFFQHSPDSPRMSGRDFRVGFVRSRQLGFEAGAS